MKEGAMIEARMEDVNQWTQKGVQPICCRLTRARNETSEIEILRPVAKTWREAKASESKRANGSGFSGCLVVQWVVSIIAQSPDRTDLFVALSERLPIMTQKATESPCLGYVMDYWSSNGILGHLATDEFFYPRP